MLKRLLNLGRPLSVIAAVAVAASLLIAPAAAADAAAFEYAEGGEDAVATFTATDPDADAGDIEWSLGGVDAADFEIDGGVLTFKKSPDFEKPTDRDEVDDAEEVGDQGKGDNVYKLTVLASGGSQDVVVTVTNVDEPGKVKFDQPQPQVSRDLRASFSDEDGDEGPSWQWSRGASMDGPWTDIVGAMTSARRPTAADEGMYLRATVTYEDSFGSQTASGVTANAVEPRTLANAAPMFPATVDPISVNENVTGAIGDPIIATDADNDILLYSIVADVDANDNGTIDDAENTTDDEKFTIGSTTGQLSLKNEDGENFESANNRVTDADADDDTIAYTVTIRATDPSGATGDKTITVNLKDVNESPAFTAPSKDQKTLYVTENVAATGDGVNLYTHKTNRETTDQSAAYDAEDNDATRSGTALDADAAIRYTLEGADDDEDSFSLDDTTGALTSNATHDFEDQSSYSLVIVATSGGTDAASRGTRTKITKLSVTVMVVDAEDTGSVDLSAREPQVGRSVIATLKDDDGGETAVSWQWYRGGSDGDANTDGEVDAAELAALITALRALEHNPEVDPNNVCGHDDNDTPVSATQACVIDGATSALYSPVADDENWKIRAVASYKDAIDSATEEYAIASSERAVERSDPANTAPVFPDQDLNTAGDQSDTAMRSVKENAKGEKVGEPIGAVDADKDLLLYTHSGDDAGSFNIDKKTGQLTTKVKLDFEAKDEYTVTVTATDPSGAYDMITVTIMVTDEDDPAVIMSASDVAVDCNDDFECSYAEAGTVPVATFTATDLDADAGDIEWSLGGVDAADFEIDGGVLTFKKSPDFEKPTDRDEVDDAEEVGDQGKGDNVYKLTVLASGGSQDVVVTVTNVDEPGKVKFDQPQPQVSRNLRASFSDEDGDEGPSWQWSRGASMDGPWTDIVGAMTSARRPTAADEGMYLRATVTYEDSFGSQTASGVTANAVEPRTLANAAPMFPATVDPISVNENVTGAIGDPIIATDADNDILLYSIVADVDANDNGTIDDAENTTDDEKFTIGSTTGQLSLKNEDGENFESANNRVTDADADDDTIAYTVTIRATDPSGATGDKTITVNLKDVNESPAFTAPSKDQKTLYVTENVAATGDGVNLYTHKTNRETTDQSAAYDAEDNDATRSGTALDADAAIRYTLEGADDDEDSFSLDDTTGALTSNATHDFEDQSSYSLVIVATSGGTDAASRGTRTKITKLSVTVMVVDAEDTGSVDLSAREPQVGRSVIATLKDDDGGETAVSWQWYRGGSDGDANTDGEVDAAELAALITALRALEHNPEVDPNNVCGHDDNDTPVSATQACVIDGATSALYSPVADDENWKIRAVASYKDAIDSATEEYAIASSERAVERSDPANTAPVFPDQDLNTAGDQSDTAMRSVKENAKGEKVGEPIGAVDADKDLLLYTHSGDDAGSFNIDKKTGQLTTKVKLDFEAKDEYTVTVTATDPSGAYDMITVTIMVTDEDDGAVIALVTGPGTNAPEFPEDEDGMRSVAENSAAGTEVGAPVAAIDKDADDTLTYTLSGADADAFEIDSETGQITVGAGTALDAETRTEYSVDVTATDEGDNAVTIAVTITVEDVSLPGAGDDHDANSDEMIDRSEAVSAVMAYFDGEITKGAAVEVIGLYFSSGG